MQGHNLMQAIARVNRVFKDKQGGLVVDYIGIAENLKDALAQYTESDRTTTGVDTELAAQVLLEKMELIRALLHGHDYRKFFTGTSKDKVQAIVETMEWAKCHFVSLSFFIADNSFNPVYFCAHHKMVFFSPRCDEESISVFARCPDRVVFHFSCQHTL